MFKGQPIYLQSLVNVLIKEVKKKGKMAFVGLDEEVKNRFSDSQYVRFTEAVFTHPVLQGKELKVFQHLLYKAAQFAGLNQFKRNGEPMDFDYFVNRCLQNETYNCHYNTDFSVARRDIVVLCIQRGVGCTAV